MKDIVDRAIIRARRIEDQSKYDASLLLECVVEIQRLRLREREKDADERAKAAKWGEVQIS